MDRISNIQQDPAVGQPGTEVDGQLQPVATPIEQVQPAATAIDSQLQPDSVQTEGQLQQQPTSTDSVESSFRRGSFSIRADNKQSHECLPRHRSPS